MLVQKHVSDKRPTPQAEAGQGLDSTGPSPSDDGERGASARKLYRARVFAVAVVSAFYVLMLASRTWVLHWVFHKLVKTDREGLEAEWRRVSRNEAKALERLAKLSRRLAPGRARRAMARQLRPPPTAAADCRGWLGGLAAALGCWFGGLGWVAAGAARLLPLRAVGLPPRGSASPPPLAGAAGFQSPDGTSASTEVKAQRGSGTRRTMARKTENGSGACAEDKTSDNSSANAAAVLQALVGHPGLTVPTGNHRIGRGGDVRLRRGQGGKEMVQGGSTGGDQRPRRGEGSKGGLRKSEWGKEWLTRGGTERHAAHQRLEPVCSLNELLRAAEGATPLLRAKAQSLALASRGRFPVLSDHPGGEGGVDFVRWDLLATAGPLVCSHIQWARPKDGCRAIEKMLRSYDSDESRLLDCCRFAPSPPLSAPGSSLSSLPSHSSLSPSSPCSSGSRVSGICSPNSPLRNVDTKQQQ